MYEKLFSKFSSSWAGEPESEFQAQTRVTVLIKRIFHIAGILFIFLGELEPQHLREAGTACRIRSQLPSSSTQTQTTANQMKPGGQTRCPLRLIYCFSKETLTADHTQVRRLLLSTA